MSDIPEIQRRYRINIIPAGSAEPVNPIDLGRRTKFGGSPDEIQPRGQSGIVVRAAVAGGVSLAKSIRFSSNGQDHTNRKDYGAEQFRVADQGMIYVRFCLDCLGPLATMDRC
jgi:hypothetical protein